MSELSKILLFSILPVATMVAGGIGATLKKPGPNLRSMILHFAAGVVFSVVAVEILPDVIKNHSPLMILIGFTLGFLVMIAVRRLTERTEENGGASPGKGLPWGLLSGVGVDIFIDGLLLGIGFAAGATEGMMLSLALAFEFLSLGMATAAELGDRKIGLGKSIGTVLGLALVFFTSAVLGATLLRHLSHGLLEVVLSFGLSALLFLVTEELLTEAHEQKETTWNTSAFFGGFLIFLILGIYV